MLAVGGRAGQGLGDKVLMRGESTKVVVVWGRILRIDISSDFEDFIDLDIPVKLIIKMNFKTCLLLPLPLLLTLSLILTLPQDLIQD